MSIEDNETPASSRIRGPGVLAAAAMSTWLSVILGLASIAATVFLWRALLLSHRREIVTFAQIESRSASVEIDGALKAIVDSLKGISERNGGLLRDKGNRLRISLEGLRMTLWVEPSGRVGWVVPQDKNQNLVGTDLTETEADRNALTGAAKSGLPSLTPPTGLPNGDWTFHLVVPVFRTGELQGFLVAELSTRELYAEVLRPVASGWALGVFQGDRELYRRGSPANGEWVASGQSGFLGAEQQLEVGPTAEMLARLQSRLPAAVLAAGCVISLLLAAAVALAQSSWRRTREAELAQTELRESEEQYRLLFDGNPHPMWLYDPSDLRFLAVNDAAVAQYGYSRPEFLGMTLADIRPPEDVAALVESVRSSQEALSRSGVWRHRTKDGRPIDVEIVSQAVRFGDRLARLVLARDVTERMRLEEQVRHSQKMDAVGRLAGGVAHDFNNILGVIIGYAELLQRETDADDKRSRRIEQIQKAANRAVGLTRQLLAFSRKEVVQPRVLDLNAVVSDIEKMLQRLIGEDVELQAVRADDLGKVKADPGQIEQILMNLAVNARDAMPRGGRLTIETANVDLDALFLRSHADAKAGPYVMLAVSDTGLGMDPSVLAHIFEPFFTTKGEGKGTGLGLATVHGIVKQSGGHIFVYTEPGQGTTFKTYFPRVEDAVDVVQASASPVEEELPRGSETVLLVEDESSLRGIVRECLETAGYRVLEALHSADALDIANRNGTPIDLLVTDVVMPGMSGRELAECLKSSHPEMDVLYMSGYTDDAVVRHGILNEEMAFVQKPFTTATLARRVREVLDRGRG